MMTKNYNKLYEKRIVSLRDYELKNAIKSGGCKFIYNNKVMTKTPEELMRNFQVHKKNIQSKYNINQTYQLIDFIFTSDEFKIIREEKQLKLI